MTQGYDQIAQHLQDAVLEGYSQKFKEEFLNPSNIGKLQNPDSYVKVTGPCGDTMKIWLKVKNGRIDKATFWTDGCGTSIACGSMVTELIKGKTIAEVSHLRSQDILNALGGLPEADVHCSILAADTLREALKDYSKFRSEPWKRAYQRKG